VLPRIWENGVYITEGGPLGNVQLVPGRILPETQFSKYVQIKKNR
jgi:hypothetical protein